MKDETSVKLYESERDRFRALMEQEKDVEQQITHWGPAVEQLAGLAGETLPADVQERINALKNMKDTAGLGLTDSIRWVFKQPSLLPLTPTDVRNRLAEMGMT